MLLSIVLLMIAKVKAADQNELQNFFVGLLIKPSTRSIFLFFHRGDHRKSENRANNNGVFSLCYRLCVLASGSCMMDRFSCLTAIKVSCLHLGQYSGKFSRTVSSRIFNRVLLPQKGHKIHSIFMLSSSVLGFLFFLPDGKLAVFLRLFLLTALGFPFQLTLLMLEFQRLLRLCSNTFIL